MIRPLLIIAFTFLSLHALSQQSVATVYFVGDAGEPVITDQPLGHVLRRMVTQSGGTVVFLGDNIYPKGMPDRESPGRAEAEMILRTQAGWIQGTGADAYFIPGNHDWQKGGRRGWEFIKEQQRWIDSLGGRNIHFEPQDGCPGPTVLNLNNTTVLVIIDSQWFLHPFDKPGEGSDCECKTPAELLAALGNIFEQHYNKRVILAAHHPLVTYGEHGGVFPFKQHLFPLTDFNHRFYLPLPVIGSVYPLYRKLFGNIQDTAHPRYKALISNTQELMARYPGSVYVAGHEHALEYIVKDSSYFIVSGSGSKTTFVKKGKLTEFAASKNGFVRLDLLTDGTVHVSFIQADKSEPDGTLIFGDTLAPPARLAPEQQATADFTPAHEEVTAAGSNQYKSGKARQRWLGANYRKEWSTPVNASVFDIGEEKGGLTIVKKGGGMQTRSLRLADAAGREYVLRSVEKYPENAVPETLRKTFAQDLVQDQISAAHPYAALVVPFLAEAAGVYHTNPRLVYIPDDPRLGQYRKEFANTLALFEERPDNDWSDAPFFGNSKKIISTTKVLEKLADDNDNQVDQKFVIKSRLFDMLIGDWDRHDDQWRWATFEDEDGDETYRPIPRDRDQAFFVNEGILPKIWTRRWALPKFEGFDDEINWPSGLSFNARYFDRSFLTELSLEDWQTAAKQLQSAMTDDVIEKAIKQWPASLVALHGDEIIRKLKARRGRLAEYAREHYLFLTRAVDIVGSDKRERFEVESEPGGLLKVQVFKINKEGDKSKKLYERLFKPDETREVRLYGLDGDDHFEIDGESRSPIKVRIIGGGGTDVVDDDSEGVGSRVFVYDLPQSVVVKSGHVRERTANTPGVNEYNRKAFQYDRLAPLLYGNFNADDGLFVGGGFLYQNHGFRKTPFRQRHILLASIAPRTNSYNFLYRGDFMQVLNRWNLELNLDVKAPNFVNNFFGWGNDSEFNQSIDETPGLNADDAIDYYRFRFEEIKVETFLARPLGGHGKFRIGPTFQRIEIEEPDGKDRYVHDYAATLPYNLYTEFTDYAGLKLGFAVDHRDDNLFTRRGVVANLNASLVKGLDKQSGDFQKIESDVAFYYSFRSSSRLVLAARMGGGVNFGDYEFYQAQVLDGRTELRGYRKTRFYGDAELYTNVEARIKLSSLRTYLFPASFGILFFNDSGRVWYEGESSTTWHNGWGGGIWFTPFNATVMSVEAGHSSEGTLGYFRFGFLF